MIRTYARKGTVQAYIYLDPRHQNIRGEQDKPTFLLWNRDPNRKIVVCGRKQGTPEFQHNENRRWLIWARTIQESGKFTWSALDASTDNFVSLCLEPPDDFEFYAEYEDNDDGRFQGRWNIPYLRVPPPSVPPVGQESKVGQSFIEIWQMSMTDRPFETEKGDSKRVKIGNQEPSGTDGAGSSGDFPTNRQVPSAYDFLEVARQNYSRELRTRRFPGVASNFEELAIFAEEEDEKEKNRKRKLTPSIDEGSETEYRYDPEYKAWVTYQETVMHLENRRHPDGTRVSRAQMEEYWVVLAGLVPGDEGQETSPSHLFPTIADPMENLPVTRISVDEERDYTSLGLPSDVMLDHIRTQMCSGAVRLKGISSDQLEETYMARQEQWRKFILPSTTPAYKVGDPAAGVSGLKRVDQNTQALKDKLPLEARLPMDLVQTKHSLLPHPRQVDPKNGHFIYHCLSNCTYQDGGKYVNSKACTHFLVPDGINLKTAMSLDGTETEQIHNNWIIGCTRCTYTKRITDPTKQVTCPGLMSLGCKGTGCAIVDPLSEVALSVWQYNAMRSRECRSKTCFFLQAPYRLTHPAFQHCEIIGQQVLYIPNVVPPKDREKGASQEQCNVTVCGACGYNLTQLLYFASKSVNSTDERGPELFEWKHVETLTTNPSHTKPEHETDKASVKIDLTILTRESPMTKLHMKDARLRRQFIKQLDTMISRLDVKPSLVGEWEADRVREELEKLTDRDRAAAADSLLKTVQGKHVERQVQRPLVHRKIAIQRRPQEHSVQSIAVESYKLSYDGEVVEKEVKEVVIPVGPPPARISPAYEDKAGNQIGEAFKSNYCIKLQDKSEYFSEQFMDPENPNCVEEMEIWMQMMCYASAEVANANNLVGEAIPMEHEQMCDYIMNNYLVGDHEGMMNPRILLRAINVCKERQMDLKKNRVTPDDKTLRDKITRILQEIKYHVMKFIRPTIDFRTQKGIMITQAPTSVVQTREGEERKVRSLLTCIAEMNLGERTMNRMMNMETMGKSSMHESVDRFEDSVYHMVEKMARLKLKRTGDRLRQYCPSYRTTIR